MGKVAGAALKIAAPEAAVAAKAAGKGGAGKDPRKNAPGSKAAQQRQAIEDLKGRRPDVDEDLADEHEDQADEHERRPSPSAPAAGMSAPATGGGVVLGFIVYALVRAYIGNPGQPSGAAGVKRLVLAKFLNKTS